MLRFAICIIICAILSPSINADDPCTVTGVRGTINITSLSSTDGKAKFADLLPTSGGSNWKYSWNPCQPFSEGATCQGVAVCQVEANGPDTHILGTQDSAKWDTKDFSADNPTLSYTYNGGTGQRNVQIELICNDDPVGSVVALGERDAGFYYFQLSSICSCFGGCQVRPPSTSTPSPSGGPPSTSTHSPSDGGSGLHIGIIFVIVLAGFAVVYFAVYALHHYFYLNRSGRDLIARQTF